MSPRAPSRRGASSPTVSWHNVVGNGASARAVGQSLGRNPFPIVVPCHRIVAADGTLGGFSAPGGTATKRRLLTIEDARLDSRADLFDTTSDSTAQPARSA